MGWGRVEWGCFSRPVRPFLPSFHRRSQDFLCGAQFFLKKFFFTFLVVVLDTRAKITKLTTPTLQPSPPRRPAKISSIIDLLLCLRMHLQLTPINYAKFFFLALGCTCTPMLFPSLSSLSPLWTRLEVAPQVQLRDLESTVSPTPATLAATRHVPWALNTPKCVCGRVLSSYSC